jgi:pilus assembly protein CpaF
MIKVIEFIENSFLQNLLINEDITDISYNGEYIYYQHNQLGRQKSNIIIDNQKALDFLRHIANLTEQLFSFSNPILDVSVGHYRINGVGPTLARKKYQKVTTFSIRIGRTKTFKQGLTMVNDNSINNLLKHLIKAKISIVIAGPTGSGKTELQKYLISLMEDNQRIIVIDNVLELEGVITNNHLDINIWQTNDNVKEGKFSYLVENGLRSHPDWLIVAEARGQEMVDVLTSAMTGHPIITTIHSQDIFSIPNRMTRMVLSSNIHLQYQDTLFDVKEHFPILIYLKKGIDNKQKIIRYIEAIGEMDSKQKNINIIYQIDKGIKKYRPISTKLINRLKDNHGLEKPIAFINNINEQ